MSGIRPSITFPVPGSSSEAAILQGSPLSSATLAHAEDEKRRIAGPELSFGENFTTTREKIEKES